MIFSISGPQIVRFLEQAIETRGKSAAIVCDNGTEFTSKAMFFWSQATNIKLGFIQPGKPTQNVFVESLNGKFRNECLNQHWFRSLGEAEAKLKRRLMLGVRSLANVTVTAKLSCDSYGCQTEDSRYHVGLFVATDIPLSVCTQLANSF